jgi:hypothetical protein
MPTNKAWQRAASSDALRVDRAYTKNIDGVPWPPLGDGWRLIRATADFAFWRRFLITTTPTEPPPPDAAKR